MALTASLQDGHVYAQYFLDSKFRSNLFKVPVLLAALSRKGSTEGQIGRPGAAAVVGRPMTASQVRTLTGSTQHHVTFQTSRVGGVKVLGSDDTTSTTGTDRQDKKKRSTAISWTLYDAPITLRNQVLRKNKGGFATGSAIEDATEMAMEELLEQVAGEVWHGSPASMTDDDYSSLVGLVEWLNDDNQIGSINRASVDGFNAYRDDTGVDVSLNTIDDVNLDPTKGLAIFGGKSDIAITAPGVYKKLKQQALAQGGTIVHDEKPEASQVGTLAEYIHINGTMLTMDPYATNSAGTEDHLAILDSSTWTFESQADNNVRVTEFVNQAERGPHGSDDVTTAKIFWGARQVCNRPKRNALLTNVT